MKAPSRYTHYFEYYLMVFLKALMEFEHLHGDSFAVSKHLSKGFLL
jgi:hypothetical protein